MPIFRVRPEVGCRMASQFTVYKEDLDEFSGKGGAKKNKAGVWAHPCTVATPPQEEEPSFFPQGRGQEGGKVRPPLLKGG